VFKQGALKSSFVELMSVQLFAPLGFVSIDTPEIRGKCEKEKYDAKQAREMVADILKDAEQITLKRMERGKYFRITADVIVDGENLATVSPSS